MEEIFSAFLLIHVERTEYIYTEMESLPPPQKKKKEKKREYNASTNTTESIVKAELDLFNQVLSKTRIHKFSNGTTLETDSNF